MLVTELSIPLILFNKRLIPQNLKYISRITVLNIDMIKNDVINKKKPAYQNLNNKIKPPSKYNPPVKLLACPSQLRTSNKKSFLLCSGEARMLKMYWNSFLLIVKRNPYIGVISYAARFNKHQIVKVTVENID